MWHVVPAVGAGQCSGDSARSALGCRECNRRPVCWAPSIWTHLRESLHIQVLLGQKHAKSTHLMAATSSRDSRRPSRCAFCASATTARAAAASSAFFSLSATRAASCRRK